MSIVYKVWSDNFNGDLLSVEAYNEPRFKMSTGDFCVHRSKAVHIKDINSSADIICFNPEYNVWHKVPASHLYP
jgi:hypothetical protein